MAKMRLRAGVRPVREPSFISRFIWYYIAALILLGVLLFFVIAPNSTNKWLGLSIFDVILSVPLAFLIWWVVDTVRRSERIQNNIILFLIGGLLFFIALAVIFGLLWAWSLVTS